jgi:hypothetical protein
MVGMIIIGAMTEDEIGVPFADESGDFAAVLQVRFQFAVVDVEHLGGDTEKARGLHYLRQPAFGQRTARLAPMADVAIGDGDEFHLVSFGGPHRRGAAGLDFTVVRMGAEADDTQRSGALAGWSGLARQQAGQRRDERDDDEPEACGCERAG